MSRALLTALRALRGRPSYVTLVVATIALGLGACLTALTVVHAVLYSPLPFPDAERLAWIGEAAPRHEETGVSLPALERWRHSSQLSGVGAFTSRDMRLTRQGDATVLRVALVSGDLFSTLGTTPLRGRAITPADDKRGAAPVAVISYALWRSHFASRSESVGSSIELDGQARTIVGVMPEKFRFPSEQTAVWVPAFPLLESFAGSDGVGLLLAVGRLRHGASFTSTQTELREIESRVSGVDRDERGYRPYVRSLRDHLTRDVRPRMRILAGAAVLMMLLALANVANMGLTQLVRRRQEFAVRQALGARREDILRQLVAEGVLLGVGGVALGSVLGSTVLRLAGRYASDRLPELATTGVGVGAVTIAVTCVALVVVTLIVGLGDPTAEVAAVSAMRDTASAAGTYRGRRFRSALASSAIAITVLLLGSAAILTKSYFTLARTDLGIDPKGVYVARIARPYTVLTPNERPEVEAFMRSFLQNLVQGPDVSRAAISTELPGGGNQIRSDIQVDRSTIAANAGVMAVSPEYFTTLRIPLQKGRFLTADDLSAHDDSPPAVAVIDAQLARRLFAGVEPVGRALFLKDLALEVQVVGVVADVRQAGATGDRLPQLYLPYSALPLPWVTVLVRSSAPPSAVLALLRRSATQLDRDQTVANFASLDQLLADRLDRSEFYSILLASFAVASVLLTTVSLYGVLALLVAQRRQEFGIRLSIGATPRDIYVVVMRYSLQLAMIGVTVGVTLTLAASSVLRALLYGIDPVDLPVLGGCAALIFVTAVVAAAAPARAAARVDPSMVMRADA